MNLYESLKDNLKESYTYNWRDDIEDMTEDNSEESYELFYRVAENMVDKDEYGEYADRDRDECISEEASNIIGLWKISKRSRLYKYLLKWYGSEEKLLDNVRDVLDTPNAIYFVTGCGYSIFDADLLGGNANGEKAREFDQFVAEQEK